MNNKYECLETFISNSITEFYNPSTTDITAGGINHIYNNESPTGIALKIYFLRRRNIIVDKFNHPKLIKPS